jgi:parallel beta-helix repeat protein
MRIPRLRTLTGLIRSPAIIAGCLAITRRGGWKAAAARLGAVALLAGGLTVATGSVAQASVLHCGEVIIADTKLTSDLVGCPDNGIVIGADNTTVDLNGHVIAGDGTSVPSCPADLTCDVGVENTAGHSHVTITGGSIRQFDTGVGVGGGAVGDYIHHLAVSHTSSFGLFITQTTKTIVDHNVVSDPGITAVALFSSAEALVASNVASGSTGYAMFLVDESNSLIQQNTLTSSGHGFAIGGAGNVVRSNVVTNSGGSIDVFDGSTSTRVEFNHLSNVGDGVIVGVASGTVVEHNVVSRTGGNDRGGFGVILDGSAGTTVDQNTINATGPGIYVAHLDAPAPPTDNRITRNVTTSKNADGILVDPDATGTLLSHNLAVRSGEDGIDVRAPGTTVTLNIANANHNLGISAAPGVIDGGGNRAAGNGNPAQCTNIVCA